ncbi:MAG: hypothetical protein CL946_06155 [Ectothiorhodospiraceae bacterium]|nr:hypothetical protein [Ectothiorhodospiraceae bacterium]
MRLLTIAAILTALLSLHGSTFAQDDPSAPKKDLLVITLKDGSAVYGRIVNSYKNKLELETFSGESRTVYRDEIADISPASEGEGVIMKNEVVTLKDTDGSSFVGTVVHANDKEVTFKTLSGLEFTLPRDKVESIVAGQNPGITYTGEQPMYVQRVDHQDYQDNRLFVSPTGRIHDAGTHYISFYYIFLPALNFGVADIFSLGFGMSILPSSDGQLWYFNPKFGLYQSDELNISATWFSAGSTERSTDAVHFGTLASTFGDEKFAVTTALGVGIDDDGDVSDNPVAVLGIEAKIGNGVKFISENFFIPGSGEDYPVISFGLRWYGEHVAGDFALWRPISADWDGFPFIPFLSLSYKF